MKIQDPLVDLLTDDHIALKLRASTKQTLLADLARRAAALTDLSEAALLQALAVREALGSTGFGAGVAIPHARIDGLKQVFGFLARLEKPIPFDAIDGRPVDLVFLLLSPTLSNAEHLATLAAISRKLRDKSVADALRIADMPANFRALLA